MPFRMGAGGDSIEFVHLPREVQRSLPFLDSRYVGSDAPRARLSLNELPSTGAAPAGDCHFIFHSAFCCSTLLGRALDEDNVATVLQEPQILADFAGAFAAADDPRESLSALASVLALLQRPHLAGETTILKLGNAANGLIDHLLALRPQARAVIMYAPLPLFLSKIAIGGRTRRRWARSIATLFCRDRQSERDLLLLTDLEAAAYVWLQHQAQFADLLRGQHSARFAVVEAGDLLDNPLHTLCQVAETFGLGMDSAKAARIVAGPAFSQEAKVPGKMFDPATRRMDEAAAKFAYGLEIDAALEWAHDYAERTGIHLSLRQAA